MSDEHSSEDDDLEYPRAGADLYAGSGRFVADLTKLQFGAFGYERGYREAADVLYERMTTSRTSFDSLLFPLAYLWCHGIELQIKRVALTAATLRTDEFDEKALKNGLHHHHLYQLWTLAKEQLLAAYVYSEENPPVGLEDVERVLRQLDTLDPLAFGFRFHEDRHGRPSLHDPPETLDIVNFHRIMRDVHGFVEAANMELTARLDVQSEIYMTYRR